MIVSPNRISAHSLQPSAPYSDAACHRTSDCPVTRSLACTDTQSATAATARHPGCQARICPLHSPTVAPSPSPRTAHLAHGSLRHPSHTVRCRQARSTGNHTPLARSQTASLAVVAMVVAVAVAAMVVAAQCLVMVGAASGWFGCCPYSRSALHRWHCTCPKRTHSTLPHPCPFDTQCMRQTLPGSRFLLGFPMGAAVPLTPKGEKMEMKSHAA